MNAVQFGLTGPWVVAAPSISGPPRSNYLRAPIVQECRLQYTEVVSQRRLSYLHRADFIPGVTPYDVLHELDLEAVGNRVRLRLTFDRMHDATWTQRAAQGWGQELDKLEKVLTHD
jgi:hypothetical protein